MAAPSLDPRAKPAAASQPLGAAVLARFGRARQDARLGIAQDGLVASVRGRSAHAMAACLERANDLRIEPGLEMNRAALRHPARGGRRGGRPRVAEAWRITFFLQVHRSVSDVHKYLYVALR